MNTEHLLLDAVNILLESINQLPIQSESEYEGFLEANQARLKIIEVTRAVLSEKWDINTDKNYVFPIDEQGMIPVPANVLDIVGENGNVIMRNWRLYSKSAQSHIFTAEVPCEVVWAFDFNSLTHPLRHYITIRAARIFAARTIGDKETLAFNANDEDDALNAARRSEGRTGNYNIFTEAYGVNNRVRVN